MFSTQAAKYSFTHFHQKNPTSLWVPILSGPFSEGAYFFFFFLSPNWATELITALSPVRFVGCSRFDRQRADTSRQRGTTVCGRLSCFQAGLDTKTDQQKDTPLYGICTCFPTFRSSVDRCVEVIFHALCTVWLIRRY